MTRLSMVGIGFCSITNIGVAAVLLAHADQHWQRSDESPWNVQLGFQVRLAEAGKIATDYFPLGTSAYPFEGIPDDGSLGLFGSESEGSYVIQPSDDIHFSAFETLLTNNQNDEFAMHLFYWNTEGSMFLSPAVGGVEWTYTGTGAIGADLEQVRLQILDIDIDWNGSTVVVDADIRWEFWGTPVPAPTPSLAIVAGVMVAARRRR